MKEYIKELLEKGERLDKRKFDEYRKIEVKPNVVKKAEGSAWVDLGGTKVLAGVKLSIGEPFKDTPDEGILLVNAEFTPLAHEEFEPGPPSEDAVELSRLVDRAIRESHAIELDKLVIETGKKVWIVHIDIAILNHNGNLLDASTLASVSALLNTRLPKVEGEEIVRGEYVGKLPVAYKPVTVTIGKYRDKLLVDPRIEEEEVLEAKLSIGIRDDDKICSMQKQGNGTLTLKEIEQIIDLALEKSKELRACL